MKTNKFISWIPRVIALLFIIFLALMSLDVISQKSSFQQIMIGLFMHNIPVFILLAALLISLKHELIGGIAFILAGILINVLINPLKGYSLSYILIIAGPAFLIGILFIVSFLKRKS